jgi:plastocyanin
VKRQIALIVLILALVCVGFFGSSASGGGGGCFDPVKTKAVSDVSIRDRCFRPTIALVETGTTVTWTNYDSQPHNVGLVNAVWASKTLRRNDSVSYRFEKPGVFPYICYIHAGMSGAVVVGDPEVGAVKRAGVGTHVGFTKAGRSKEGEDAEVGSHDEKLQSKAVEPAASEEGGEAIFVFLVAVGALLMVAVIFLALNRRSGSGRA